MNKIVLTLLLASLLLAGCVRQPQPTATSTPPIVSDVPVPTPTPFKASCTDDDGGKEFSKRAFAKTVDATGAARVFEDNCSKENELEEFYCDGTVAKSVRTECACTKGACTGPSPEVINFTLVGAPSEAFITPCVSPNVVLNVLKAPAGAQVRFYAEWAGRLTGYFNPVGGQVGKDGFAETRVGASAGCSTSGNVTVLFTAEVCNLGRCLNKTLSMPFTAVPCLEGIRCQDNTSISS